MGFRGTQAALLLAPALVFLALWFVAPLLRLFSLAFTDPTGPWTPFATLIGSPVYRQVFFNTLLVAVYVTVICVLLAYPVAWLLNRLKGTWYVVALYCVLFPLWISVLVRTFSWMLLLERNGPVNGALMAAGIVDQPLNLLFSNTAVAIGMVHVMLPYAVLPIYAAMTRIDPRLLQASDGLGASLFDTFFRVYLPLTMPGVLGGAAFVFLLSLGFFITPALLGGLNAITLSMLIENLVNERLDWTLAAAAALLLLLAVLMLLALAARFVRFRQGSLP